MTTTSSDFKWTDENVAKLREMYAAGATSSKIASAVGGTRNAVIGKVYRLGIARPVKVRAKAETLPKAEKPARIPGRRQGLSADGIMRAELRPDEGAFDAGDHEARVRAATADSPRVPFLERGMFQCAMWIPGAWDEVPVGEKLCCGRPVVLNTSWCRHCVKIVASPPSLAAFKTRSMMKGVAA